MTLTLEALKVLRLMLARHLRRFLRLTLEKPFTDPLIPQLWALEGLTPQSRVSSWKETVERDPPTAEET